MHSHIGRMARSSISGISLLRTPVASEKEPGKTQQPSEEDATDADAGFGAGVEAVGLGRVGRTLRVWYCRAA